MHLGTAAKNALYTSWNIQNQLIHINGEQMRDHILQKVKKNKFVSNIADEVTDSACMVLRIIADKVTTSIIGYGLDINNLGGQAYDGSGNMAGISKGTAAIIKEPTP
ncbi:putative 52 kDa repressor of the inhibitor of the protein kinase-like 21 [Homarus americanus]|uniref:Putative 52 kDa repressor of the inhibitor of the protein kinase-like 21 n=1 Tax=Homarus americanus TaxID=6706 RepID=A0A8J5JTL7_HOMAM|nr:putative 52 kDa repressor of the inhibitor of the protein kinase-like 21 [Homarus americanus]